MTCRASRRRHDAASLDLRVTRPGVLRVRALARDGTGSGRVQSAQDLHTAFTAVGDREADTSDPRSEHEHCRRHSIRVTGHRGDARSRWRSPRGSPAKKRTSRSPACSPSRTSVTDAQRAPSHERIPYAHGGAGRARASAAETPSGLGRLRASNSMSSPAIGPGSSRVDGRRLASTRPPSRQQMMQQQARTRRQVGRGGLSSSRRAGHDQRSRGCCIGGRGCRGIRFGPCCGLDSPATGWLAGVAFERCGEGVFVAVADLLGDLRERGAGVSE